MIASKSRKQAFEVMTATDEMLTMGPLCASSGEESGLGFAHNVRRQR